MKKETKKKIKKEKVTLEKLASLIEKLAIFAVNGFERMESQMVTKEEFNEKVSSLKEGQNSLKQGQVRLEHEVGGIKSEVSSIKEEQKDHTRRLISIERKLTGTQISLDETVHRSDMENKELSATVFSEVPVWHEFSRFELSSKSP